MSEMRFVYKKQYYEYSKGEVNPCIYEDDFPGEFIKLLCDRASRIKRLESSARTLNSENPENQSVHEELAETSLNTIYEIEKEIAKYMTEENIECEWYAPTGTKCSELDFEEQRRQICFSCGEIFPHDSIFEYGKDYHPICPKCKSENIHLTNIYQYKAEKLEEISQMLIDEGQQKESIKKREEEIEELKKIDPFYDEIYAEAIGNIAIAYQNIATTYLTLKEDKKLKVLPILERSVEYWDKLLEMDCLETFANYEIMANCHFLILQTISKIENTKYEEMRKELEAVHTFSEEARNVSISWCENKFMGITEETVAIITEKEEDLKLASYALLLEYCIKNNLAEKIDKISKEALEYVETCEYTEEARLNEYRNSLKKLEGGIRQTPAKKEGCYIATAVYGSYDTPEVLILRRFRDDILKKSIWGRGFIKTYYTFSPSIAKYLKKATKINQLVRYLLDQLVIRLSE